MSPLFHSSTIFTTGPTIRLSLLALGLLFDHALLSDPRRVTKFSMSLLESLYAPRMKRGAAHINMIRLHHETIGSDEDDLSSASDHQRDHSNPCPDLDDQLGRSCSCRTGSRVDQAGKGNVVSTSDPTSLESATLVNDLVDGFGDGWIRWSYCESSFRMPA
jgi:hypothetical protein